MRRALWTVVAYVGAAVVVAGLALGDGWLSFDGLCAAFIGWVEGGDDPVLSRERS